MPTVAAKSRNKARPQFGPRSAGMFMSPAEFDEVESVSEFVEGYRYELINGVLVVSPSPLPQERGPNEQLGYWLLFYRDNHPQGNHLNGTLPEHTIRTAMNRRRADRVIWAGVDHQPKCATETPPIIAEFVSAGKRDHVRDYEEKRDEYLAIGVKEYWIFDRFQRTLTVFTTSAGKVKTRVIREKQAYTTPLLPGLAIPLNKLFAVADAFAAANDEDS